MSKTKRKTRTGRALALLTALLMVLSVFAAGTVFAADEEELKPVEFDFSADAPGVLSLSGDGVDEQGLVFTFELSAVDGAPLPDKTTVSLTEEGNIEFGKVTYTEPGRYSYEVKQTTESFPEFTLDETVYEIHVLVQPNDADELYTMVTLGEAGTEKKPEKIEFENSYEQETLDISGSKTWDDNDDQDGERPESITVRLLADGTEVENKVVKEADGWKWSFEDLPKYCDGEEITYTITEDAVSGYSTKISDYDVENVHTPGKTSLTVTKAWDDANDQDGARPADVTVTLNANGKKADVEDAVVKLNKNNNWTYTWTELDEKADGAEIEYTVEEAAVDGYKTEITGDAAKGYTITNTHTPETLDISGSKTWDDNDDQDGERPESITIRLLADGTEVENRKVSEAEGWKWSFEELPKYDDGKEIVYTVTEDAISGYSTEISGYDVKNIHTPGKTSLTVTKVWDDADDQDGLRPGKVEVTLNANGKKADVKDAVIELNGKNNWTYTWTELDEKADGAEIEYTVEEAAVDGYKTEITGDAVEGYTVTNAHTPETLKISGSKTWDDNDDQDGKRPVSIRIRLLADGTEVSVKRVTETNGWKWNFRDLPKYSAGNEIVYTITEDAVRGYSTEINEYDVTNVHTPGKTSLTVTKVWEDGYDQDGLRPADITVTLNANGAKADVEDAVVKLSMSNNWTYTWTGLDEKADGEDIEYTVDEVAVDGYGTVITGDAVKGFTIINTHETVTPVPPVPPTGDTANMVLPAALLCASIIIIAVAVIVRRRSGKKE